MPNRPSLRFRSLLHRACSGRISRRVAFPLLVAAMGWFGQPQRVEAQVFVPHTVELNPEQIEQVGFELLQDADRWARFQQFGEALPRAELASQLLPQSAQAWAVLGSVYVQSERVEEGLTALRRAQSIEPENAAIRFTLGSAYFQGKDYSRAIAELQAGLELMPNTPGALFDLGNAYFVSGQLDLAMDSYEEAFAQNGEFWPALNNIGLVLYEQGQIDGAIGQWESSTALAPEEAEPLLARAAALYAQGALARSLALAEKAIQLDRRYTDLEFLELNLWGEKLLADVERLLSEPRLQALLAQTDSPSPALSLPR